MEEFIMSSPKDFEDEIEDLLKDYGAPEHITEGIREFLIDSGYVYSIVNISKEYPI